ncbi:MAG: hypothetical protein A2887_02410 [Alphaproteobacteria bacterium RIFCSPLOWO2_01_FULL_40_26]|nr:MAG: hypothetical protein A3D15_03180 [Alphaproteobacteria bacterium RIFCSPHIGHO2_02_FULL_40_34]OFW88462.1 MAG: hypothetical protein A2794_04095 [Alphaproteobacteria bacterium RIFCSPHIGHO2_01_FULL_40_8]OFW94838.1 MAG: hypothetical protein A2887_02410 [Alphaproteobacteria bacterium RIFCSPLOWO2_01_FULL_40_26]OFX10464.1 MAG: hypothetical protein A3H30_03820 [Alphaproteobacteria bacterium RIFCSPLOWO2_02_FULL_40_19]OFX11038.1 MAG: hypothetical protein A3G22_01270 [Alphaproteobacteria bacterium RI
MFESVIKAKHIDGYKIWLTFDDGSAGEIDLTRSLKNRGGVFRPLRNMEYFKKFKIENDTLSWNNGADLAPEFLYEMLKKETKNKTNLTKHA